MPTLKHFLLFILFWTGAASRLFAQYSISTVAGNGFSGWTGSGGPATAAGMNYAMFVFYDHQAGNLFFTTQEGVRMVNSAGIMVDVAGSSINGYTGDGGPATAARLSEPHGIVKDSAGNLFIADNQNYVIRKIDLAGVITTYAGTHTLGYSGDGGPASAASLSGIDNLAFDKYGSLYLGVLGSNRISKIDAAGILTTVAGTGVSGFSGDGGPATAAKLFGPSSVAFDTSGNMYISDLTNARIRKVNAAGIITTIAGTGITGYNGDNRPATSANINPTGIAVDNSGNIFFADEIANRIRKIDPAGIITTIAGNGTAGFLDDSCTATAAELNRPGGIFLDTATGVIYIADKNNNRVRKLTPDYIPRFVGGDSQFLLICRDTLADSLNGMLTIKDTDTGQAETWTVVKPPLHGAFAGSYSAVSNGGVIVPTGLYYKPATGYYGTDTFRVAITDCSFGSDTTIVYVYIDTARPHDPGVITGKDTICIGDSTAFAIAGGPGPYYTVWSVSNSAATLSGGMAHGISAGADTITYTLMNGCGRDTSTMHIVHVVACRNSASTPGVHDNEGMRIWPNPNDGSFTVSLTSALNEAMQITVTDITGRTLRHLTAETNKNKEIHFEKSGLYFITVTTSSGKWCGKVVAQ